VTEAQNSGGEEFGEERLVLNTPLDAMQRGERLSDATITDYKNDVGTAHPL
jgi:hypothetical protein